MRFYGTIYPILLSLILWSIDPIECRAKKAIWSKSTRFVIIGSGFVALNSTHPDKYRDMDAMCCNEETNITKATRICTWISYNAIKLKGFSVAYNHMAFHTSSTDTYFVRCIFSPNTETRMHYGIIRTEWAYPHFVCGWSMPRAHEQLHLALSCWR